MEILLLLLSGILWVEDFDSFWVEDFGLNADLLSSSFWIEDFAGFCSLCILRILWIYELKILRIFWIYELKILRIVWSFRLFSYLFVTDNARGERMCQRERDRDA